MKKLGVLVAAFMVIGVASAWAQTNAFVIDLKGTITQKDGTKIQLKDVAKGVTGLVSTDSNVLVLITSKDDTAFEIDEVNPVTSNTVHAIMGTFVAALLDSGQFNGDLEADGTGHGGSVTSFPAAIPDFSGDVQATGRFTGTTKPGVTATLQGVWNDQKSGATNQPPSIFKGTLRSTGTITVPQDCCHSF
jgi:hypothetical protein